MQAIVGKTREKVRRWLVLARKEGIHYLEFTFLNGKSISIIVANCILEQKIKFCIIRFRHLHDLFSVPDSGCKNHEEWEWKKHSEERIDAKIQEEYIKISYHMQERTD